MSGVYVEENGVYEFDFSHALNVEGDLKSKYKCIGNALSDVDFIVETEHEMLFVEYKNTDIENVNNPEAFNEKIKNGVLYDNLIKKYYGSAFYILSSMKYKPITLVFIIESRYIDSVWRKRACASIMKRLPFELQNYDEIKSELIKSCQVLSIDEWNDVYSVFSMKKRIT